jgi:sulfonate dioxygenase
LFVNQGFTRRIVGFKQEESATLLNFLFDHIAKGADFQTRAKYRPGTVVVWGTSSFKALECSTAHLVLDNRVTVHSATIDFESKERRHAVRLTPQAEQPIAVARD